MTPTWLVEGVLVSHPVFGTGRVAELGDDHGMPTVWIDFGDGELKAISVELGSQFLDPRRSPTPLRAASDLRLRLRRRLGPGALIRR